MMGTCAEECKHDGNCNVHTQKCCFNGCGHSCMEPYNASVCVYNQVAYPIGATIQKDGDPCSKCVCMGHVSHYSDGFACAVIDCPSHFSHFSCPANHVLTNIPGKCCPECVGKYITYGIGCYFVLL